MSDPTGGKTTDLRPDGSRHLPPPFVDGAGSDLPTRTLVVGLTDRDGRLAMDDLLSVAESCSLTAEQVRSCMRRLVAEGLYARKGSGRHAVFHTTETGTLTQSALRSRHLLAYAQDAAGRGWDRRWRLVSFAIPESLRSARNAMRDHLRRLGGALVQPGLYASPHPWDEQVETLAEHLGVSDFLACAAADEFSAFGSHDPREIAGRLWELEPLAARYRAFIDDYRDVPDWLERQRAEHLRLSDVDWLPGALAFAQRFSECFADDPLLPPELLPRPWPGREARSLVARCRRLGTLLRADRSAPALFWIFDDAIAHLP